MIAVKRTLSVLIIVAGLALVAVGATDTEPCPLPTDAASSTSMAESSQSPEKEKCMRRVQHNGMPLCLPCPAAEAHMRHGDADLGDCTKPGNEK